jgi:hypothetical protein
MACSETALLFVGGRITLCLRNGKFLTSLSVGVHEVLRVRNYAARRGTREKTRKKKKPKFEVKKVGFISSHST